MSDLLQLKQAMDARYQAQQAVLRDLARQEGDLRRALSDLDDMRQGARALPDDQLAAPRAIGADLLWQGWTQRTRQELNVQLAQVLVRKAEKMSALRQAFGRAEAVSQLLVQEKTARRKAAQDRDLQVGQQLALLRAATSSGG
ncbi:hypothetical protein [Roseovarius sp. Pro17]|uniref:hypothetical protein n=1 Tax=Roseovarius sp. Pro17 TaxID=3108175 RepID=UPI002D775B96|nr:hypothetical protein [Roseovarius sp. Pro17]